MTLILGLSNSEYALVIGDRRLKPFGGASFTEDQREESPKVGLMFCGNARVGFGFSGLARTDDGFDTHRWICETLTDCGRPRFSLYDVLTEFAKRADETFRTRFSKLSAPRKRLCVLFLGFNTSKSIGMPGLAAIVTNHSQRADSNEPVWDSFKILAMPEPMPRQGEPAFIHRIGRWPAAPMSELKNLFHTMLVKRAPPKAIFNRAVEYFREVARRPKAADLIGDQIIADIVPSDPTKAPTWDYSSAYRTAHQFVPALVYPGRAAMGEVRFQVETLDGPDAGPLMMGGPRRHRNAPCHCGSGKRFRDCHGRRRPKV